jgi:hypothetical protein
VSDNREGVDVCRKERGISLSASGYGEEEEKEAD